MTTNPENLVKIGPIHSEVISYLFNITKERKVCGLVSRLYSLNGRQAGWAK